MVRQLPNPMSVNDEFAAAMVEILDEIRGVLIDVRDRLPAPSGDDNGQPAPSGIEPEATGGPAEVKLREPRPSKSSAATVEPPAVADDGEPAVKPRPARKATPAKKVTGRRASK